MKKFLHLLTLLLLILTSFLNITMAANSAPAPTPTPTTQGFCGSKCQKRCEKAGVQDRCIKYCGICCDKCGCVPSGTYGNKHECPCYGHMKNSKGNSKCP